MPIPLKDRVVKIEYAETPKVSDDFAETAIARKLVEIVRDIVEICPDFIDNPENILNFNQEGGEENAPET